MIVDNHIIIVINSIIMPANTRGSGGNNAAGAPVAMTQQQLNALLNGIVSQVNAANEARVPNPRNNAAPSYAVPPEQLLNARTGDMEESPLGKRFQDGTDVKITNVQWKEYRNLRRMKETVM